MAASTISPKRFVPSFSSPAIEMMRRMASTARSERGETADAAAESGARSTPAGCVPTRGRPDPAPRRHPSWPADADAAPTRPRFRTASRPWPRDVRQKLAVPLTRSRRRPPLHPVARSSRSTSRASPLEPRSALAARAPAQRDRCVVAHPDRTLPRSNLAVDDLDPGRLCDFQGAEAGDVRPERLAVVLRTELQD